VTAKGGGAQAPPPIIRESLARVAPPFRFCFFAGMLGVKTVAWGQYASRTGNFIGAVGGACDSSTNTYGWPDANGDILKCVSNVWTPVTQPATAAGSTGYIQFNSSGVLGASSNLFWDSANFRLGIGSSAPVVSLDLSQKTDALALPVGTQGQEPASPMNGMIRYSTTANDVEAYIAGAWTTLTTGGSTAAITLGTSAATPAPASSYSAATGLFSPASAVVGVTSAGTEMMRVNGTGVGIGTTSPSYLLHVGSPSAVGVVADFQNSSGYCTFSPSANGIMTTCTSDVRLKKDIVDVGDALAWLGTMRIRDFTLKATGERRTGVIAQEMMKVHPEMVRMGSTGFYQVDVPDAWKLIKAIQELKAENDDLVNRIGAEDNALKAATTTSPTCARRSKRTKLSIREQRSKRHRFAIKSVAL
jgi:hypothetical protein